MFLQSAIYSASSNATSAIQKNYNMQLVTNNKLHNDLCSLTSVPFEINDYMWKDDTKSMPPKLKLITEHYFRTLLSNELSKYLWETNAKMRLNKPHEPHCRTYKEISTGRYIVFIRMTGAVKNYHSGAKFNFFLAHYALTMKDSRKVKKKQMGSLCVLTMVLLDSTPITLRQLHNLYEYSNHARISSRIEG